MLFLGEGKERPTCLSTLTNFPIMLWSSISDVDALATYGSFLGKSQRVCKIDVPIFTLPGCQWSGPWSRELSSPCSRLCSLEEAYLALEVQALQQLLKPNKNQAVLGGFGSELIKHLAVSRGFKVPLNHIPLAFSVGLRLRASTLNVCGVGWAGVEGWLISEILHSGYQHSHLFHLVK